MKVSDLNATHPDYDADAISEARDLFEGGERMRKNVAAHLIQNDVEPRALYRRRCKAAHYVNYCGPIGGYFGSFVASKPLSFQDVDDQEYWTDWAKDSDGAGTDFNTFFAQRLIEALTVRCALWRVKFHSPTSDVETLQDMREEKADRAELVAMPRESVIDWQLDDDGNYLWLREYQQEQIRPGTGQEPINCGTWIEWRADGSASRWQAEWKGDGKIPASTDVPEVEPPYSPIARLPIVSLALPQQLFLMGHLASPQLELFRKRCALAWAIDRTCYAMPYFFLEDSKRAPVMGVGYYGILGAKDRVEWPAPPPAPFQVIADYNGTLKDEIHRIAQVMARSIDNSAASVGRSGESKQADDRATEIVVSAYADRLREAAQSTVELISEGAGRGKAPTCAGLREYSILDATATIEQFLGLQAAQIHSVTAMQEAEKRALDSFLPGIEENKRAKMHKEIEAGLTQEELDAKNEPAVIPKAEKIPMMVPAAQANGAKPKTGGVT